MSNPQKNKAIFLDRDGVINVERSYIKTPDEFDLYPFTAEAIKQINASGYLAIVVTNQAMIARGMADFDELDAVHQKMQSELAKTGAHIDAIYYCPHHPGKGDPSERREFIMECNCRKPKPGMLFKAAEEHDIDLTQSYFIGDTGRDIEAGHSAGCKTIGVKTGHALKDAKLQPDKTCSNLAEAVAWILMK